MNRLNWIFASSLCALVAAAVSCSDDNPSVGPESEGGEGGSAAGEGGEGGEGATSASGGGPSIVDGGEGGEGGEAGAGNCGTEQLTAEPKPVNVLLVVDKSLSMASTPEGFGEQKWAALSGAIEAALAATSDRVSFGLDFFPYSGSAEEPLATACSMPDSAELVVPIDEGADATAAINSAMAAHEPAGATPTAAALARALAYFESGGGMTLEGDLYVLLATDGGPNCNDQLSCEGESCTVNMDGLCPAQVENCCDANLDPDGPGKCLDQDDTVAQIEALAGAGVKTFVLGIPGTDAYEATLNAMAVAGEVENPDPPPSYYAVSAADGVEALSEALLEITSGVIRTCELVLEMEPPDPNKINVVLEGETIAQEGDDGWELVDDPPTIVLKGETCTAVEEQGVEHIEIVYGCPTVRVK